MSRMIDGNKVAAYITHNEGYRRDMYKDSVGIWTIGIGFNLQEGFTEEECKLILRYRMGKIIHALCDKVPSYIEASHARKTVLIDMTYNLGITGLLRFRKMLAALDRGDFELAADEMLDSRYAGQVGGRAHRNAKMMRTGEWYE